MKKFIILFSLVFIAACTQAAQPEMAISIGSTPLMQETTASVHIRVRNPGKADLKSDSLVLGYARENETSMIQISEIPLSLAAGQVFEQDVPWKIDFQPDAGVKYELRLMLLSSQGDSLGETSIPVEFTQPSLAVEVNPAKLSKNALATISIRVSNTSGVDWEAYKLLLGYGAVNDTSMIQINEIPLSLAAGQVFEQDIPWNADVQKTEGVQYQVRLALLSPENVQLAETSTPIEIAQPGLSLTVDPVQLNKNTKATIHVQVNNPSNADWQDYKLDITYGAVNDMNGYLIQEVPLSLKAGETVNQEFTWIVDYIPSSGNYEVRASILSPDNVVLIETNFPITLSAH